MTQLLVSVRSGAEAREALAGGAQWIDAKDPHRGSLGRPAIRPLVEIREAVEDRATLSAACGELLDAIPQGWLDSLAGYALAKAGLSRCAGVADWPLRWAGFAARLPGRVSLVAVAYADHVAAGAPHPLEIVQAAQSLGCPWLLVDTFDKSEGGLFERVTHAELAAWLAAARQGGMRIALAGSLTRDSIPRALALNPEIIAVRGAACPGGRDGTIARDRVGQMARQLSTPLTSCPDTTSIQSIDEASPQP